MDDALLRLLEVIFRSPGDVEAGWRGFEAIGAAISPDVSVVTVVESSEPPTTALFGVGREHAAPGHLPRRPGPGRRIESLPLGTVFELPRLPPPIARNPVIRALIEPEGLLPGPALGIVTTVEEGRATSLLLVLPRSAAWKPRRRDRLLMERIAPFVIQSAQLHVRLLASSALTTILDHLVLGVVLADEHGRVTYVNRSAAEMLGVEPGESHPSERRELDARSRALYRTIGPVEEREGLYPHPVDGRPLHILSTKLTWPSWRGYVGRRFARALFIGDPNHHTADPFGNLGTAYGLTEHEARLAALLVGDFSLAEASERLGITQSTARTVLKRVLAKTGTRRQASLVRLLLSGPGQIRDGGAPIPTQRRRGRRRPSVRKS